MNIAQEKGFYNFEPLEQKDIDFLTVAFLDKQHPELRKLNQGWIDIFTEIFRMRDLFEKSGLMSTEVEEKIDEYIYNIQEKYHSKIEGNSARFLESLLNMDLSFMNTEEDMIDFLYYICVQYIRTAKIKHDVLNSVGSTTLINTEKIWTVLSHIVSTSMGWTLYHKWNNFTLKLLANDTDTEYITGDQPVINTQAEPKNATSAPEELEIYYPLSQKLAILITKKSQTDTDNRIDISEGDVIRYNRLIFDHSDTQVFAASETILQKYQNI